MAVTPQDFADVVAGPGDGECTDGGLPRRVQGLLPGSMVSSESEWTAESSSESSATYFLQNLYSQYFLFNFYLFYFTLLLILIIFFEVTSVTIFLVNFIISF